MEQKPRSVFFTLLAMGLIILGVTAIVILASLFGDHPVLRPQGWIGEREKKLLIDSTLLMLIVVIPVFFMTFVIAWRYRAGNKKAKYDPSFNHSHIAEGFWWGVPCAIILVLSILTWQYTHSLDPYKPINGKNKPLTIQVIALQWKWLFVYPEQNIATVNYIQIPEKTPIVFDITADAPMNSFWIPALGGQIFAMPKMKTKLHLIADEKGVFRGSSANISGKGFSGMVFDVKASTQEEFDNWVKEVKSSPKHLDQKTYDELAGPTSDAPVQLFVLDDPALFDKVINKYMMPNHEMKQEG